LRFFGQREAATAHALLNQLLDLRTGPRVPLVAMVDERLAEERTDGWRYEDMPEDGQAWRESLAHLDDDSIADQGSRFAECSHAQQRTIIARIQERGSVGWHGLDASHIWSLWTRYACTAYYSHPSAWSEMGFPGPAFPRGYASLGVDALERFEVKDTGPDRDAEARPSDGGS
jgi:hypothetical protein